MTPQVSQSLLNLAMAVAGFAALVWAFRNQHFGDPGDRVAYAPLGESENENFNHPPNSPEPALKRTLAIVVIALVFISFLASIMMTILVARNASAGVSLTRNQD
ncbi:hypothetical protein CCAX7_61270 [Capsulimonas corticalis]|uniref:Uncharacterized protein n=2 Tax=Capsulimonas corticalis TaxID=2219043 RepID=A0A402CW78_9BACT|nr:hypothetical protein CCAX7_61270 [Capsulimonas corticalis]